MALYRAADTPIHRLNPAGKLLLLALFFAWTLRLEHALPLLVPCGAALLALTLGRGGHALRAALPLLLTLGVVTLLFWTLLGGGVTPLSRFESLVVSPDGVRHALAMTLRLETMLLGGLALVATTSVEALRAGLCRLRVPFPVAFAVSLAFRLIPLFAGALEKAVQAQRCRGFAVDAGGPLARLRNYAPLLIPAILVSLRTTDHLAAALEGRAYGHPIPRTALHPYPWRWADTLCALAITAALATTWVWR
ncbi:MAG: Energy-coupling factor transporter transmembrane protein EcfT [bacterium ADurb.Bin429]|nr:MAG: Energy-coupling factor transporter transmembrane protein EcfT [bacterium ADurb.Bin429]